MMLVCLLRGGQQLHQWFASTQYFLLYPQFNLGSRLKICLAEFCRMKFARLFALLFWDVEAGVRIQRLLLWRFYMAI